MTELHTLHSLKISSLLHPHGSELGLLSHRRKRLANRLRIYGLLRLHGLLHRLLGDLLRLELLLLSHGHRRLGLVYRLLSGLGELIRKLLVGHHAHSITSVLPQVGSEVRVGLQTSLVGRLDEVAQCACLSGRGGVHVIETSELEDFLRRVGSNDASTARGGDESHTNRATLSGDLEGHSVGSTISRAPVSFAHGNDSQLSSDNGTSNGCGNLFGALYAQSNMRVTVTHTHESFESGSLSSTRLLLNGHDLHDFVFEAREEVLDDLVLFDGEGKHVNFFEAADLSSLN